MYQLAFRRMFVYKNNSFEKKLNLYINQQYRITKSLKSRLLSFHGRVDEVFLKQFIIFWAKFL